MFMCVLTCVEILGRKFFGFSLNGVDELGGYAFAIVTAFGFSLALVRRTHTRVDIALERMPRGAQAVMNMLAAVALAGVAVFMAARAWAQMQESLELMAVSNSPLQVPMWIPHGLWFVGLALFAVIASLLAARALSLSLTNHRALNASFGPPSIQREVEEEMAAVQNREALS
jgi:TRAP-type C4-dicarboxylate transport system permease small subunit